MKKISLGNIAVSLLMILLVSILAMPVTAAGYGQPDIKVASFGSTLGGSPESSARDVTLSWTIDSSGQKATGPFSVQLKNESNIIETVMYQSLDPKKGSDSVSGQKTVNLPPGAYDFTIVADSANNVAETNENNNIATVHVVVPRTPVVVSMTVSPHSAYLIVGETQQFVVKAVDQYGDEYPSANLPVVWTTGNSGGGSIDQTGLFTAIAWDQLPVTATVGSIKSSAHVFIARPTPEPCFYGGACASDNSVSFTKTSSYNAGQETALNGRIVNGDLSRTSSFLQVNEINDEAFISLEKIQLSEAETSFTVFASSDRSTSNKSRPCKLSSPCEYRVRILDSDGILRGEMFFTAPAPSPTSPTVNIAVAKLSYCCSQIAPPPYPPNPSNAVPTDTVGGDFNIYNTGTTTVGSVAYVVYLDNIEISRGSSSASIPPGGSVPVQARTNTVFGNPGWHKVSLLAVSLTGEANEYDNLAMVDVWVSPPPMP